MYSNRQNPSEGHSHDPTVVVIGRVATEPIPVSSQPVSYPIQRNIYGGNNPPMTVVGTAAINGTFPSGDSNPPSRDWNTGICECSKDWESCWWGLWCCWILQARTTHSMGLGNSLNLSIMFWIFMIGFLILFASGFGFLSLLYLGCGGFYLAYTRGGIRTKIRERFGIYGHSSDDLWLHFFCSCCVVCQEAREAKYMSIEPVDYCSGELLTNERHELAISHGDGLTGGNFFHHLSAVSKTSKIILNLSLAVAVLCLFIQFVQNSYYNIAVLLLVFVQPFLILYFVYWRPRRKNASLDYVIKIFAYGFWFTTFQSVILEMILQFVITLSLAPFLGGYFDPLSTADSGNNAVPTAMPTMAPTASSDSSVSARAYFSNLLSQMIVTALQPSTSSIYPLDTDSFSYHDSRYLLSATNTTSGNDTETRREMMKSHIVVVVIGLFLMAFVVAAGVEETMKHFSVRCCQFPVPLRDPHTILVYMMAGALGFATAENIEYVFGASTGMPGMDVFVGELVVLLMRVLMPIHVICSVLQAARYSKHCLGIADLSTFQVLLPAILLHGTYDFVLFLLSTLQFVYNDGNPLYELLSMVLPIALTILGVIWACILFGRIQKLYDSGWNIGTTQDETESIHNVMQVEVDISSP